MDHEAGKEVSNTSSRPPPGPEGPKFPVYGFSSSDLESDTSENDVAFSEDTTDVFAITVTDLGSESDFGMATENYRQNKLQADACHNLEENDTSALSDRTDTESTVSRGSSDQVLSSLSPKHVGARVHTRTGSKAKGDRGTARKVQGDVAPWYLKNEFDRYWRHYQAMVTWCQQHSVVSRILDVKYGRHSTPSRQMPRSSPLPPVYPWSSHPAAATFPPCLQNPQLSNVKSKKRHRHKHRRNKSRNHLESTPPTTAPGTGSEMSSDKSSSIMEEGSECETEEYEMHVSEELIAFYAETEKFRQQRDAEKKKEQEKSKEEKFVDMEDVEDAVRPTAEAPKQRPGALRTSEMRLLYGQGAAMIHGMETALQMTYDRNLDIHQPRLWPNIPYRLVFK